MQMHMWDGIVVSINLGLFLSALKFQSLYSSSIKKELKLNTRLLICIGGVALYSRVNNAITKCSLVKNQSRAEELNHKLP